MIDLSSKVVIRKIIDRISSQANMDRKNKSFKAKKIFDDVQKPYVLEELKRLYPKTYEKMRVSDISLTKQVVNKKAKAYKEGVIRILDKRDGDESKKYQEVVNAKKLNKAWKSIDKILNTIRYAFLWVLKDHEVGEYRYRALWGHEFDLILDEDTGEVEALILSFPDNNIEGVVEAYEEKEPGQETVKTYAIWTKKQHVAIRDVKNKKDNRKSRIDFIFPKNTRGRVNKEMVNPWGRIPGVFVCNDDSGLFPECSPLSDQSTLFNIMVSDYLTATSSQGFGQLVIKKPHSLKIEEIENGMFTALEIPLSDNVDEPQGDASYINASPDLEGQSNTIMNLINLILSNNGINSGEVVNGGVQDFASALDRMISQGDCMDSIEENQGLYADGEQEVFEIVKSAEQAENKFPFKSDRVQTIYKKPKPMRSDKDIRAEVKEKRELGLIHEWEKFKILDPNLTDEECKDRLNSIDKERAERASLFGQDKNKVKDEEEDGDKTP